MKITAELKSTKQTKSVSQDNVYTLIFVTENPMVMDLGKLSSNTLFTLDIGIKKND